MRSFVADGNFKADHLKQKGDESDIQLTNGEGFMTNNDCYNAHLAVATDTKQVTFIYWFIYSLIYYYRNPVVTAIGRS